MEKEFLDTFIRNGSLIAKTLNQWNDVDHNVELDPLGRLKLSVGKDLYQELGLSGVPSFTLGKVPSQYCITVDLLNSKFQPGSKYYERIVRCLRNHKDLEFDWIMKWEPHVPEICPSSLAAYLDAAQFNVSECQHQLNQHQLFNREVPHLNQETDLVDLVEWVGAAILEIECPLVESHASSFTCLQPYSNTGQVSVLRSSGLFSVKDIESILNDTFLILKENDNELWFNLTIHGFDDHPSTGWSYTVN